MEITIIGCFTKYTLPCGYLRLLGFSFFTVLNNDVINILVSKYFCPTLICITVVCDFLQQPSHQHMCMFV